MNASEKTIRQYLARSAGNCNIVSLHTIRCFIGMVQTCEADVELFRRVGGDRLVEQMETEAEKNQWGPLQCTN
jgi:hypothetical protein